MDRNSRPLRTLPSLEAPATVELGSDGFYTVRNLRRDSREEALALADLPEPQRIDVVHRWLALGAVVDKRVGAVADADYLGRESERVIVEMRGFLEREVRARFDPNADDSLTRPIVEHAQSSRNLLVEAQNQLRELLRTSFDPNDARSVVAKIGGLLAGLEKQMEIRFDPKRRDSVLGRFDERLDVLMKRLTAPDGPFQVVMSELQTVRAEIARVDAARTARAEVLQKTPLKGTLFEDELEERLATIARVHGDVIERVGTKPGPGGTKRGDMVMTLSGKVGRIVVEAKSGTISSLPKLLSELEMARAGRNADLAVAVVRDVENLPLQARPFQFYDEGIVVCAANLEFAIKVARWVVAVQNAAQPAMVDAATAQAASVEILGALKRLRPARQQLKVIERAAEALRETLQEMEQEIVDAVKTLDDSITVAA